MLFQIWYNDTVIPVVGWCLQKHFRIKIIFLTLCREVPIALSAVPIVGRQLSFKSFKIDVSCNGWCTTTIQTSSFERTRSKLFHFALSTTETLGSLWLRMSSNPFWNSAASGVTVMLRGCCLVNLLPTFAATRWKYSKQNQGWKYGTDEFMAWKKTEESRIHFVHNFYGLPLLQISSFKSECVMPTSLNASTLISLEQKRHVQLYEEESVFLLSLEYSVPAFASI